MWLLLEDALHRQAGMHVARLARDCALGGLPGTVAAWELFNVEGPAALQGPDVVGALALTSTDAPLADELRCVCLRVCLRVCDWALFACVGYWSQLAGMRMHNHHATTVCGLRTTMHSASWLNGAPTLRRVCPLWTHHPRAPTRIWPHCCWTRRHGAIFRPKSAKACVTPPCLCLRR